MSSQVMAPRRDADDAAPGPVSLEASPSLDGQLQAVRTRLLRAGFHDLSKIRIRRVEQGHLRLEGEVATFYRKQLAQEAIRQGTGVSQLDNQLAVCGRGG